MKMECCAQSEMSSNLQFKYAEDADTLWKIVNRRAAGALAQTCIWKNTIHKKIYILPKKPLYLEVQLKFPSNPDVSRRYKNVGYLKIIIVFCTMK